MIEANTDFTPFSKLALNPFHEIINVMKYFWVENMYRHRGDIVLLHLHDLVIFLSRVVGEHGQRFLYCFLHLKNKVQWKREENYNVLSIYYITAIC